MSTKKKKRPADINKLAASIVADATDDDAPEDSAEEPADDGKNPHAVALGRMGGLKGGKARAKKLSSEERSAIAKKAAKARWEKKNTL